MQESSKNYMRIPVFISGIGIILLILMYMLTFQLRFHEAAIIKTFGKVTRGYPNSDGGQAGLKFKWPWPVEKVHTVDARLRVLEDRLEQQETRDKQVVIVNAYMTWRISDPVEFYRTLTNEANAEAYLRDRLSAARSVISEYTFDDLTNVDPSCLKITEAQEKMLAFMRRGLSGQGYGIELENMGIKRIILPESITQAVFGRMRMTRQRLAQSARSEGNAIARSIRARAMSDQKRIMSFAARLAQNIRAEGDEAAARYYHVFKKDEDFAIFIRRIESLKTMLKENTTFILDSKIAPFDMLKKAVMPAEKKRTAPVKTLNILSEADKNKIKSKGKANGTGN